MRPRVLCSPTFSICETAAVLLFFSLYKRKDAKRNRREREIQRKRERKTQRLY